MEVIIRPSTRAQFTLPVGYYETMLEIKTRTQLVLGLSTPRLTLYQHGHQLSDDLTASQFAGTTIDAVVNQPTPPITLFIQPSNGDNSFTIKLEQYWDFTIRQIKEKIHQERRIHVHTQNLFHRHRLLEDHLTLQSTRIQHHSVLDLHIIVPLALLRLPPPPPIQPGLNQQQRPHHHQLGPQASNPPPNSHQAFLRRAANSAANLLYRQMGIAQQPPQYQSGPRPNLQQGLPTSSHQRASGSGNNQRLIVRVVLPNQAMPVHVEVKPWDRVETLRRALCEALQRSLRFPPLGQAFCFYHERRGGMFEDETFESHDVNQGDRIYFSP